MCRSSTPKQQQQKRSLVSYGLSKLTGGGGSTLPSVGVLATTPTNGRAAEAGPSASALTSGSSPHDAVRAVPDTLYDCIHASVLGIPNDTGHDASHTPPGPLQSSNQSPGQLLRHPSTQSALPLGQQPDRVFTHVWRCRHRQLLRTKTVRSLHISRAEPARRRATRLRSWRSCDVS